MASPDVTSGQIMDKVASLLNDTAKTKYTYTAQLPYLNIALQELEEWFELYDDPVTDSFTSVLTIIPSIVDPKSTGLFTINFVSNPALPPNLIAPQVLWERTSGIDPFIPMTKMNFLPRFMERQALNQLIYYTWESNGLNFFTPSTNTDIKIDYLRNLFSQFVDTNGQENIGVINAKTYLEYKTAALCASFIGENETRSRELNGLAESSMYRATAISSNSKQNIITRRRPFRSAYKRRSFM